MFKVLKKMLVFMICIMLLLVELPMSKLDLQVNAATRTFYVDAVNGNDSNNGTNVATAWKTLDKVNNTILQPGDKVLLKAECVFAGEKLKPQGSGEAGNPIIFDKYGTGAKPHIATNGAHLYAFELYNQQYIEINNLEISNLGSSELAHRTGIKIRAKDAGVIRHIYLKNLHVHDVNGNSALKDWDNGGIYYVVEGNSVPTKYDDILIEGCTVENVNRSGIFMAITSWYAKYDNQNGAYPQSVVDTYSHTNVIIRNNVCREIGGDGIVSIFCKNPLIERNVIIGSCKTSTSASQYSAAIWPWRCEDAIFQYNEVYDTYRNADGQAFDCDWSNRTVYQYNYSHDNVSGFIMFCKHESLGSIVRYNISENDGTLDGVIANINGTPGPTATIYNNTIYTKGNTKMFRYRGGDLEFYNNIFYNEGVNNSTWDTACTYSNNAFYGFSNLPNDPNKVTVNPELANPGSGSIGLNTVDGYKLKATSPCINTGIVVANNGGKDYWGNTVPYNSGNIDIGAHEYAGLPENNIIVDDRDEKIIKSADWLTYDSDEYIKGTISYCNVAGAYYQYNFTGTNIKLIGLKNDDLGKADIYVDGILEKTIDQYSATPIVQAELFSKTGMDSKQHTIKLVVKGQKNSNSTNSYVVVDAFKHEITSTTIDDRHSKVIKQGSWLTYDNSEYYNNTISYSNITGSYCELTFTGTEIKLIGIKNKDLGKAEIYIDNKLEQTIDLYSATAISKAELFSKTNMHNKQHTIKVLVKGQKHTQSTNSFVVIDAFIFGGN